MPGVIMTTIYSLSQLGWSPFFQQQLSLDEWQHYRPARVAAQHRSHFELLTEQGHINLAVSPQLPTITVGDWLLLDSEEQVYRALTRLSEFTRKAAGSQASLQYLAANVDTVFITCSLNEDFNLNRIERYLALVKAANAEAVVVLTKADLCDNPAHYQEQVQQLDALLLVETVDARSSTCIEVLRPWCKQGKTVAFFGSSGVGKSTLVNTLSGVDQQTTGAIRQNDGKGRHTTTSRSLLPTRSGALILDTPGMRELQLVDCEQGVQQAFADIDALAQQCKYADCTHSNEPGCAVLSAIDDGRLAARRLANYQKLLREQAFNTATLAQRREQERNFTRYCRSVMKEVKLRRKGD